MALEETLEPGFVNDVLRKHPALFNTFGTLGFATSRMLGILGDQPQDGLDYALLGLQTGGVLCAIDAAQYALSSSTQELRSMPKKLLNFYRDDEDLLKVRTLSTQGEYPLAIALAEQVIERDTSPVYARATLAYVHGQNGDYIEQINEYRRMHQAQHPRTKRHGLLASTSRFLRNRFTFYEKRGAQTRHTAALPLNEFIDDLFCMQVIEGSPIENYFLELGRRERRNSIDPLTSALLHVSIDETLPAAWKTRVQRIIRKKQPSFAFPNSEQLWSELTEKFLQYKDTFKLGRVYQYTLGKRGIVLKQGEQSALLAESANLTIAADALKETPHKAARVFVGPIRHKDKHSILLDFINGPTLSEHPGDHEFTHDDYVSMGAMLGRLHAHIPYNDKQFTFTPYVDRAPVPETILAKLRAVYPELEHIASLLPVAPFIDAHGGNFIVSSTSPLALSVVDIEERGKAPLVLDLAYFIGSMREMPYEKRMAVFEGYRTSRNRLNISGRTITEFQPSTLDQFSLLFLPHLALTMHSRLPPTVASRVYTNAQKASEFLYDKHRGLYTEHKTLIETFDEALRALRLPNPLSRSYS